MIKSCFKGNSELKTYLIAYYGLLYYEEETFFGDGAVNGFQNFKYIEAHCVEEAKNLYRALSIDYLDIHNPNEDLDCLGVYTEECGEPQVCYLSFKDRPKEYQRRIHHIGGKIQDIFSITNKQWQAINNLSKATNSKFTGITKKEASEFISNKVKEVSEWKKAYLERKFNREYNSDRYFYYDGQEDDENDFCISWLDLCGDM